MLNPLKSILLGCLALAVASPALAQVKQTREQILFYTSEWKGERFPDGRPRVPDDLLKRVVDVSVEVAAFVRLLKGTQTRICCTRKTTPGLRALEKYAVRCGGGFNHRMGLDDAMLIKDNHIAVAGGIRAVLERAKAAAGHLVKIEIEVDTLDQLREVLAVGLADAVLLDNMDVATLRQAVEMVAGKFPLEASGGINLETIAEIAKTGVDYASSGWITHSVPNLDVALDIEM